MSTKVKAIWAKCYACRELFETRAEFCNHLTEDWRCGNAAAHLVLRFVAAKLKGMRVVSVGTTPSEAGEDIIIRLEGPK